MLLALGVVVLAGCGPGSAATTTFESRLVGWTAQADPPGISQLAPAWSDLHPTAVDHRALTRGGDAIRATTFAFPTEGDAREAMQRGAGDDYERTVEKAFQVDAARAHGGLRLVVGRPAEAGADVVELYLVRNGAKVTLAELVSARGFPASVRKQALAAVSR